MDFHTITVIILYLFLVIICHIYIKNSINNGVSTIIDNTNQFIKNIESESKHDSKHESKHESKHDSKHELETTVSDNYMKSIRDYDETNARSELMKHLKTDTTNLKPFIKDETFSTYNNDNYSIKQKNNINNPCLQNIKTTKFFNNVEAFDDFDLTYATI